MCKIPVIEQREHYMAMRMCNDKLRRDNFQCERIDAILPIYSNELESIKTRCAHIWNETHTQTLALAFTLQKKNNKTNQPSTQILMRHCHEVWKWERARLQSTGSTEQRAIHIDTSGERTMAYNVCQAAEIKSRIKFKHETYNERYFRIHRNRKFSFFPISSYLSLCLSVWVRFNSSLRLSCVTR